MRTIRHTLSGAKHQVVRSFKEFIAARSTNEKVLADRILRSLGGAQAADDYTNWRLLLGAHAVENTNWHSPQSYNLRKRQRLPDGGWRQRPSGVFIGNAEVAALYRGPKP